MSERVIQTSKKLSAERQIHAAIKHYSVGEFECAITLASAAEGQVPDPSDQAYLFRMLQDFVAKNPEGDGEKIDFNMTSNWLKHKNEPSIEFEISDFLVKMWLYRAISKYRAADRIATPEMVKMFPWAGRNSRAFAKHTAF
jgi:hypothetical protein